MTKNQDPYALPAGAQQRLKAQKQRRRAPAPRSAEFAFWSGRFPLVMFGGAAIAGLISFSIAWPSGMPFALYVGAAVAAVWLVLAWLLRSLQARAAASR
jgi:hypothetical protein